MSKFDGWYTLFLFMIFVIAVCFRVEKIEKEIDILRKQLGEIKSLVKEN